MNVTFNLNYLIVLGLAICIIMLIYMLIKVSFIKKKNVSDSPVEKDEKKVIDVDLFNPKIKIIGKASNTIIDKETNKQYVVVDHNDKIIFMELDVFEPDAHQEAISERIIKSQGVENISVEEDNDYLPEPVNEKITKTIEELLEEGKSMAETIENAIDYSAIQKDFLHNNEDDNNAFIFE